MSHGVIMGGSSVEEYQSGCARFIPYCGSGAVSVRPSRRKLMNKPGELSVNNPMVIVVDDDVAVRNSLKFSLEIEGFSVRVYPGGTELLNDTELPRGGCLVIDQNMPGMKGLDLLAQLRARDVAVPAILTTSYPTAAVRERAAKNGVAIVEKPLLGTALIDRIRDLFSDGAARAN
jgi:two-component system, LuxR family, response regulator FixJ